MLFTLLKYIFKDELTLIDEMQNHKYTRPLTVEVAVSACNESNLDRITHANMLVSKTNHKFTYCTYAYLYIHKYVCMLHIFSHNFDYYSISLTILPAKNGNNHMYGCMYRQKCIHMYYVCSCVWMHDLSLQFENN